LDDEAFDTSGPNGDGVFVSDGRRYGRIQLSSDTLTIQNAKVDDSKDKAAFNFDIWVSIDPTFSGDITLDASGTALPTGTKAKVVIAKAIAPVTITAKVSDIKVGLQYQETGDITIKENVAGALMADEEVYVSVSDLASDDLQFDSGFKVSVKDEAGALRIKDIGTLATSHNSDSYTHLGTAGGTIKFKVANESTEPSTITITNLAVRANNTVPMSNNRPYKAIVWGGAVAPNYRYFDYNSDEDTDRDRFDTAGVMADYINVGSSVSDSTVGTAEVRVPIGESYVIVDGKTINMDASAYISPVSNSTMVPIRFVATALGIAEDQVIWSDGGAGETKTVSIIAGNRVVQFTIGSSMMTINGTGVGMLSPDGKTVSAEITNERAYVPFRAIGDAFGIPVFWDEAAQSAVYNYKGDSVEAYDSEADASSTDSTQDDTDATTDETESEA
jgi:hypothetical protein